MTEYLKDLRDALSQYDIEFESLDRQEVRDFQKQWLAAFSVEDATEVEKALAGLHRQGFKSVAESIGKGVTVGIDGARAEEAYLNLPLQEFVIWETFAGTAFLCQMGNSMPLFTAMPCGSRWTVVSTDLDWTALLPGMCCAGQAFFALKDWQPTNG